VLLKERFQIVRPLEEMEISLVRAAIKDPRLVDPVEESVFRTALNLAKLYRVRHEGHDVGMGALIAPFREELERKLSPLLLGKKPPRRDQLMPYLRDVRESTLRTRDALMKRFSTRVPAEAIDREIRQKSLVLVAGGGGGTGYVYLGVMSLLDEFGLSPALLVGTSMGAILALFRSRLARFEYGETINIIRGLSWRKLFRIISTESRYGLPAALRLFLRAGIGRFFGVASESHGSGIKLKDLPIPTIVTVGGIRRGMLPHPLEFYERLLQVTPRSLLDPISLGRKVQLAMGTMAEFFLRPEMLVKIHLGATDDTMEFDALDAAGFSSGVPGVIHYDVLRDDPHMRGLLDHLFESRGLFRLIDGGFVDNLPAKTAWRAVHKGRIGTRNALILALNGFSPKLTTPLWLPMERLAMMTVNPNLPYAHVVRHFRRTLSPLELVPSVASATRAVELGREQIIQEMPFLCRMLTPLPAI
jgi:hypothetical protein